MASKETRKAGDGSQVVSSNELLSELASFLYDAYRRLKEKDDDKIEPVEGQIAEDEEQSK